MIKVVGNNQFMENHDQVSFTHNLWDYYKIVYEKHNANMIGNMNVKFIRLR
jgi:hypothetical protein